MTPADRLWAKRVKDKHTIAAWGMSCRLSWKIHFNEWTLVKQIFQKLFISACTIYTVVPRKSAHECEWSTYKTTSSCRLSLFNIQAGWCTMAVFNQRDAMRVELKPNMMFTCHSYKPTNPHGPKNNCHCVSCIVCFISVCTHFTLFWFT